MVHFSAFNYIISLPRVTCCILTILSVAMHGGAMQHSRDVLVNCMLFCGLVYGILFVVLRGDSRVLHKFIFFGTLVLISMGWIVALTPNSIYDPVLKIFLPVEGGSSWGAKDGSTAINSMKSTTAGFMLIFMVADMCRHKIWMRIWMNILPCLAAAIVIFALVQRSYGDIADYWGTDKLPPTVFGTYWYHANAGALLIMAWPVSLANLVLLSVRKSDPSFRYQVSKATVIIINLLITGGIWINISKTAQAVWLFQLILIVLTAIFIWNKLRPPLVVSSVLPFLVGSAVLIMAATLIQTIGIEQGLQRWQDFWNRDLSDEGRWQMLQVATPWIQQVGWFGHGSGTFELFFETQRSMTTLPPTGKWEFAHNDYIQVFLEWGWLGAGLWLILAGVVCFTCIRNFKESLKRHKVSDSIAYIMPGIGIAGVFLYAFLDFPMQILSLQLTAAVLTGMAITPLRIKHRGTRNSSAK